MLKFTGKPKHSKVDVNIQYRLTSDEELVETLVDSIKVLAKGVGTARGADISLEPEADRWMHEFVLGFSLLAIGEAQSMLLLLSGQMNRHARVHLRSLYEYQHRASLLIAKPNMALSFRDALAFELRRIGAMMGRSKEEIEREISTALGVTPAASVVGTREDKALGGKMLQQMADEPAPEIRYVGTFVWTSLVSHGSIVALNGLAKATDSSTDTLLLDATRDEFGETLLYHSCLILLWFASELQSEFGVALPEIEGLIKSLESINKRLGIVTPEQEAKVQEMQRSMKEPKPLGCTSQDLER